MSLPLRSSFIATYLSKYPEHNPADEDLNESSINEAISEALNRDTDGTSTYPRVSHEGTEEASDKACKFAPLEDDSVHFHHLRLAVQNLFPLDVFESTLAQLRAGLRDRNVYVQDHGCVPSALLPTDQAKTGPDCREHVRTMRDSTVTSLMTRFSTLQLGLLSSFVQPD